MPEIDINICISCNICVKVCPIETKPEMNSVQPKSYAVVSKDKQSLIVATSGGAFGVIAEYVFSCGGVVYGVAYSENLKVQHIRIETSDKL